MQINITARHLKLTDAIDSYVRQKVAKAGKFFTGDSVWVQCSEASKWLQEIVRNRYVYQKALLDEVVYKILYTASDKPLKERINFKMLDQDIRVELINNGINIPYHLRVETADGREIYRCPDYSEEGEEYTYPQTLFRNDPSPKMGVVKIHFPDMNSYIFSSVRFMIPAIYCGVVYHIYLHDCGDLPPEAI